MKKGVWKGKVGPVKTWGNSKVLSTVWITKVDRKNGIVYFSARKPKK